MCNVDSTCNPHALLSWQNFILAKSGCYTTLQVAVQDLDPFIRELFKHSAPPLVTLFLSIINCLTQGYYLAKKDLNQDKSLVFLFMRPTLDWKRVIL
jgi:hypothetical protein